MNIDIYPSKSGYSSYQSMLEQAWHFENQTCYWGTKIVVFAPFSLQAQKFIRRTMQIEKDLLLDKSITLAITLVRLLHSVICQDLMHFWFLATAWIRVDACVCDHSWCFIVTLLPLSWPSLCYLTLCDSNNVVCPYTLRHYDNRLLYLSKMHTSIMFVVVFQVCYAISVSTNQSEIWTRGWWRAGMKQQVVEMLQWCVDSGNLHTSFSLLWCPSWLYSLAIRWWHWSTLCYSKPYAKIQNTCKQIEP